VLARALHSPFSIVTVGRFGQLQSARLRRELAQTALAQPGKDMLDELRALSSAVVKLNSSYCSASKRCCDLTEGSNFDSSFFNNCNTVYTV